MLVSPRDDWLADHGLDKVGQYTLTITITITEKPNIKWNYVAGYESTK
jgi:hypothetical protein